MRDVDLNRILDSAMDEIAKKTEAVMLEQLGELVKRNLIRWEQTDMRVIQSIPSLINPDPKFTVAFSGRFILREQEYVEELERQNSQLRAALNIGGLREKKFP